MLQYTLDRYLMEEFLNESDKKLGTIQPQICELLKKTAKEAIDNRKVSPYVLQGMKNASDVIDRKMAPSGSVSCTGIGMISYKKAIPDSYDPRLETFCIPLKKFLEDADSYMKSGRTMLLEPEIFLNADELIKNSKPIYAENKEFIKDGAEFFGIFSELGAYETNVFATLPIEKSMKLLKKIKFFDKFIKKIHPLLRILVEMPKDKAEDFLKIYEEQEWNFETADYLRYHSKDCFRPKHRILKNNKWLYKGNTTPFVLEAYNNGKIFCVLDYIKNAKKRMDAIQMPKKGPEKIISSALKYIFTLNNENELYSMPQEEIDKGLKDYCSMLGRKNEYKGLEKEAGKVLKDEWKRKREMKHACGLLKDAEKKLDSYRAGRETRLRYIEEEQADNRQEYKISSMQQKLF